MASSQLLGTAHFDYTSGGSQTHNLAVPLQEVRPVIRYGGRWVRESLDLSNKEEWDTGSVYQVVAVIRFDDQAQSLIDLLKAGAELIDLTYDDGGGNTYTVNMIGLPNRIVADFDEEQKALDEHRYEVTLEKTDGTAFNSAIF